MFYHNLLSLFNNDNVAAVGPATTVAAGWHSVHAKNPLMTVTEVSYLIFFTAMIRRSDYDAVGGLDLECPGGDDIDLSIRLRRTGKKILVNPYAFLIHYGFKTGERVRGDSNQAGGWNSKEMSDKTNQYLIGKHGFKTYMETMRGLAPGNSEISTVDSEGSIIREIVTDGVVYELGCGARKTVPQSIGVDRVKKGETIPHVGMISQADIVCDVSGRLPINDNVADVVICRHILEHCVNSVETIKEWSRILKVGGRMVIAAPNEHVAQGIPMNPEHLHGFTPDSLSSLMMLLGFDKGIWRDPKNGISFIGVYEKVMNKSPQLNGKAVKPAHV
jgi:hypothetical protein